MARPKKNATETTTQGETKMADAPAPVQKATQTFKPAPEPIAVAMEPGKIQLAAIIAKEKTEWPTVEQVQEALTSHLARGLKIIQLTDDYWHLRSGAREASGNLKMPLKQILFQANVLFAPTKAPTEE